MFFFCFKLSVKCYYQKNYENVPDHHGGGEATVAAARSAVPPCCDWLSPPVPPQLPLYRAQSTDPPGSRLCQRHQPDLINARIWSQGAEKSLGGLGTGKYISVSFDEHGHMESFTGLFLLNITVLPNVELINSK